MEIISVDAMVPYLIFGVKQLPLCPCNIIVVLMQWFSCFSALICNYFLSCRLVFLTFLLGRGVPFPIFCSSQDCSILFIKREKDCSILLITHSNFKSSNTFEYVELPTREETRKNWCQVASIQKPINM